MKQARVMRSRRALPRVFVRTLPKNMRIRKKVGMMKLSKFGIGRRSRAVLLIGSALCAVNSGAAFAQDAAPAEGDQANGDDIVVTGTLIRGIETPTGANLLNITRDSIASTGVTAAKDLLNQTVPQLSTFNALPTGSVDFGSAVSKISLRGIGTSSGLASGTNATSRA